MCSLVGGERALSQKLITKKLKASEILRDIARNKTYEWCVGTVDKNLDGKVRCVFGALLGHFGWAGYRGNIDLNLNISEYEYKVEDLLGHVTIGELCDYNNDGHNYDQCADWLEEKGL